MIEDKVIEGKVSIGKTGLRLSVKTENGYQLGFNYVKLPELSSIGISNITDDQQFILFLDFDMIKREDLDKHLAVLATDYNISHFFILTTGTDRYHVICFEKFKLSELQPIMENSICDYSYKRFPLKTDKGWILRIGEKKDLDGSVTRDRPKYVDFIQYSYPQRKLSRAHLETLSSLYPDIKYHFKNSVEFHASNLDDFIGIQMIRYGTSNANFLTDLGIEELVASRKINIQWIEETL